MDIPVPEIRLSGSLVPTLPAIGSICSAMKCQKLSSP